MHSGECVRVDIVRVFSDASARPHHRGWGAVLVADGRKPHIMGGAIRGKRRTSTGLEAVGIILARAAAQRYLRRHGLRVELLVVHTDHQDIAWTFQEREGTAKLTYRWIAREHPMMRWAHRRARML